MVLSFVGCDALFEPRGPYEEKIVAYCVLSNKWDFTIARVYRTYNPTGINPLENTADVPIVGASVSVSDGDSVFAFRDTTIVRKDKSRYTSDIEAYVLRPLTLAPGETYNLKISSQQFGMTASKVSVPDSGEYLGMTTLNDFMGFVLNLSPQSKGYRLRFFVEFENAGQMLRVEVPQYLTYYINEKTFGGFYPRVERRFNTVFRTSNKVATDTAWFDSFAYSTVLAGIRASYVNPAFRRGVIVFTQVEDNLYNYYNIANAFQDQFIVRLDEPDFTNIPGGHGVFGAFLEQTFLVPLP
ncbi:MAG: DUF4249 family protein [Ignavibacteriales bacterium]|nr:DUF4249 family protein [Ignavibacteriales bacterium]